MTVTILAAVALLVLVSGKRTQHHDPYFSTFLGRNSGKRLSEIRATSVPEIADAIGSTPLNLSVYPSALSDGEDAVVTFLNVPNPTPQDYITVSCGPTNGLNDYLDLVNCNFPPAFTEGGITDIQFVVGTKSSPPSCSEGYSQISINLATGSLTKVIYTCYTKNVTVNQPYSAIIAVSGDTPLVPCPLEFTKIDQNLNEGIDHRYVYLCYSRSNYIANINDVEGIYFTVSSTVEASPCSLGYVTGGSIITENYDGGYLYLCLKQGNAPLPQPTSARFGPLLYMRCDYVFTYVSLSSGSPVAIGNVIANMTESLGWPTQGHISLTSNDDEMMVTYVTGTTTTPSVKYGTDMNNLNLISYGNTTTYSASQMCDSPANQTSQEYFRDPGFIHSVLLGNLSLNTLYYYQFGNDYDGWSPMYQFYSRVPSSVRNISFIAYADMGIGSPPSAISTAELVNQEVDSGYHQFLLHFGDVSYARGQAWIWENFYRMIQPYATRIPYVMSIGNHEYDHEHGGQNDPSGAPGEGFHPIWGNMGSDSGGECAVPMYHRVTTPTNGHSIFWYSFDYGPVHVIQMSTEHDWLPGAEQYLWIENDLKNVNRTQTPWVILTGHRMMYTTQLLEDADYIVSLHLRKAMEDLLYTYQVNLMLVGHQHSYERSCQVYQGECTNDGTGTIHVVIGTAGAGLETGGFSPMLGSWSLVQLEAWGFATLQATEDTLSLQYVLNESNTIYDSVVIKPWGQQ